MNIPSKSDYLGDEILLAVHFKPTECDCVQADHFLFVPQAQDNITLQDVCTVPTQPQRLADLLVGHAGGALQH